MSGNTFEVGTVVAVTTNRNLTGQTVLKRTVSKVRKDGKFYLAVAGKDGQTIQSDQMWKPIGDTAYPTRRDSFVHAFAEVWSEKHTKAYDEQIKFCRASNDKKRVQEMIDKLNPKSDADQVTIEALMKICKKLIGVETA